MRNSRGVAPELKRSIAVPFEKNPTVEYVDFPEIATDSPFKPDRQYFVRAMANGHAVGIHSLRHYQVFFKLFQRYCLSEGLRLRLFRRQVSPSLWLLIPQPVDAPKPDTLLDGDWREHGRFKYLARVLGAGNAVEARTMQEAQKIRRAWMLYTPRERRMRAYCSLRPLPNGAVTVCVSEV